MWSTFLDRLQNAGYATKRGSLDLCESGSFKESSLTSFRWLFEVNANETLLGFPGRFLALRDADRSESPVVPVELQML